MNIHVHIKQLKSFKKLKRRRIIRQSNKTLCSDESVNPHRHQTRIVQSYSPDGADMQLPVPLRGFLVVYPPVFKRQLVFELAQVEKFKPYFLLAISTGG